MVHRQLITILGIIFISIISFSQTVAASQEFARDQTIGILGEGYKLIRSVATSQEKNIIDRIRIRVPIDAAPVRVRAFKEGGQRVIEVSTGYAAVSNMIVTGYLMEAMLGISNFGEEYARYTAETYATGSLDGGDPPWVRAGYSQNQQMALFDNRNFSSAQQGQFMVVLWYVLAHEIAHHIYQHRHHAGMSLAESRRQEREADSWASNVFIKLGIPPAIAFPSLMYWYYLDENGVENEYTRAHPADLKRIKSMLTKTLDEFDVWNSNTRIFPAAPKKATFRAYKRLLNHVEGLISD